MPANEVSSCPRAQAILTGVLIDISGTAERSGFKIPVAITRRVIDELCFNQRL